MIHKYVLPLVWFPVTILLLVINLSLLVQLSQKPKVHAVEPTILSVAQVASPQSGTEQVLGATINAADARALILEKFLSHHKSPLAPYSSYIVERAQVYNIDYRMVPAIAMCESIGGKRMPSKDSYNAWGISVETGETSGATFRNWEHAIEWVSKYLYEKYYNRGIQDLISIGAIYAPPSVNTGNSWANCVQHFLDLMQ